MPKDYTDIITIEPGRCGSRLLRQGDAESRLTKF